MTASTALWPTTKAETRALSNGLLMNHRTNADFWNDYHSLPADIRSRADKQFALLKKDSQHPSLQFKQLGERKGQEIWSARVTLKYRALAVKFPEEYLWFWIGEHNVYDVLDK